MTRDERRALLGDAIIAHIHERVAQAPEPDDELVEDLRRIMTRPGGAAPESSATAVRPAAKAA
ncbi:hypothetical protein GTU99_12665 [Streptomyces sp. PRKS01-65]|nr:hypothetical protein [Streptomyces harenosi]NEY33033.1 hypothetical protein [Streptomyces harenosi]